MDSELQERSRCIQERRTSSPTSVRCPELIKKRKLQDRQIHLNLNYGMNKPPLANETMGQEQTPPTLESLRAIARRSRSIRRV